MLSPNAAAAAAASPSPCVTPTPLVGIKRPRDATPPSSPRREARIAQPNPAAAAQANADHLAAEWAAFLAELN